MAPHEQIRLETLSGNTMAYFAPNAETTRSFDNDLTVNGMPNAGDPARVQDYSIWTNEITIQGHFETSENLPEAHASALENEFGKSPVTARDQMNRLIDISVYGEPAPYNFYNEGNKYIAMSPGELDVLGGVYPTVAISQIQPGLNSGETREDYTVKLQSGFDL